MYLLKILQEVHRNRAMMFLLVKPREPLINDAGRFTPYESVVCLAMIRPKI